MIRAIYYLDFVAVVLFGVLSIALPIWTYITTGEYAIHDNVPKYRPTEANRKLSRGQVIVLKIVIMSRKVTIFFTSLIIIHKIILLIIRNSL